MNNSERRDRGIQFSFKLSFDVQFPSGIKMESRYRAEYCHVDRTFALHHIAVRWVHAQNSINNLMFSYLYCQTYLQIKICGR